MPVRGLPKLEARWRRERLFRERRSAELRRTVLEAGVPVLRRYGVSRAWLFGSVAAGAAGPGSDVDILAMPVPAEVFWPLRRDLEAALGCPLDLCTQDDDPAFVRKIQQRGELIHDVQP